MTFLDELDESVYDPVCDPVCDLDDSVSALDDHVSCPDGLVSLLSCVTMMVKIEGVLYLV
ncbi:MAG: hypothetical protein GDA36_08000 [Rhodobacteraceae bacterium]|nr:hypothetical protein [Paracoccaceae bacterium]